MSPVFILVAIAPSFRKRTDFVPFLEFVRFDTCYSVDFLTIFFYKHSTLTKLFRNSNKLTQKNVNEKILACK